MGLTSWISSFYSTPAPPAPTRSTREECWTRRDNFFACLDKEGISVPNGPEHLARKGKAACGAENKAYEGSCAQSWVDYFNKRRVLKLRQDLMEQKAAEQRDALGGPIGGRV